MVHPFCKIIRLINTFTISDIISIFSIIVNAILAVYIVRTIQKNLNNQRVLKDHFINEVKEIREEYKVCLSRLHSSKVRPQTVLPWFKLMNIKVMSVMKNINELYGINHLLLNPYQNDLRELITNNEDYIKQYSEDSPINFSTTSQNSFIVFQQNNVHLFNELIISIMLNLSKHPCKVHRRLFRFLKNGQ